jgi:hypothetical protein
LNIKKDNENEIYWVLGVNLDLSSEISPAQSLFRMINKTFN